MCMEYCNWGLSFIDTDLSKCLRRGHTKANIRFMKWFCHMVGAPILKYKRPRNTFSTARDTISCASMKANLFIRHYINVTEVLIQGLVFICMKKQQQQCVHNKYQTLWLCSNISKLYILFWNDSLSFFQCIEKRITAKYNPCSTLSCTWGASLLTILFRLIFRQQVGSILSITIYLLTFVIHNC